ncbi:P-loop NTPase family protein [Acetobacter tropicalis]|uniref:hypothetical protein n=1 Tax=Acetobacter tropicalis TaxID=104102 RepID=UPI00068DD29D|nr:hypothetical protein [Acetobacter tropicalis]
MGNRLFVGVLGNRNSGKSTTWNTLFGATVRTGQNTRTLTLYGGECVEVFLISGSPEERQLYAGDILENQKCRIILCSIQYTETLRQTLNYVVENQFDIFVQWLNPGRSDAGESYDRLGLLPWLIGHEASFSMRDGKGAPQNRTEELRQFIHSWAKARISLKTKVYRLLASHQRGSLHGGLSMSSTLIGSALRLSTRRSIFMLYQTPTSPIL